MGRPLFRLKAEVRHHKQVQRGGGLRVKGKGRKYWFIDWRERVEQEDGSARHVHRAANLGWCDEMDREQAEIKAHDLLARRSNPDYAPLPPMERKSQSAMRLGSTAELVAACHLMQAGYEVFHAINPQASCDLMALDPAGAPVRVEVKFCPVGENGAILTDWRSKIGKFDLLIVVTPTGRVLQFRSTELVTNPVQSSAVSSK